MVEATLITFIPPCWTLAELCLGLFFGLVKFGQFARILPAALLHSAADCCGPFSRHADHDVRERRLPGPRRCGFCALSRCAAWRRSGAAVRHRTGAGARPMRRRSVTGRQWPGQRGVAHRFWAGKPDPSDPDPATDPFPPAPSALREPRHRTPGGPRCRNRRSRQNLLPRMG